MPVLATALRVGADTRPMEVDLKLNEEQAEALGPHIDAARAAGCTLFRFYAAEVGTRSQWTVRLEWPKEPGAETRNSWSRNSKREFWILQSEMWDRIHTLTP